MNPIFLLIATIIVVVIILFYINSGSKIKNVDKVVLFYRPGCPWCDLFMPEWKIIVNKIGSRASQVDTSKPNPEADRLKVESVPTIIFFDKDGNHEKYEGARTADAILARIS